MTEDKEMDLSQIKNRLEKSTGPWKLNQEDAEGVYIALATEKAKWSIVALANDADAEADMDLISNSWTDLTALVGEVGRLREENNSMFEDYTKLLTWVVDQGYILQPIDDNRNSVKG